MGSWDQSPVYVPISQSWLRILGDQQRGKVSPLTRPQLGTLATGLYGGFPLDAGALLPSCHFCQYSEHGQQQIKYLQNNRHKCFFNAIEARNKEPEPPLSSSWCDVVMRQLLKSSLCWPACCLLSHLQLVSASISQVRLGIRWRSIPIRKVQ